MATFYNAPDIIIKAQKHDDDGNVVEEIDLSQYVESESLYLNRCITSQDNDTIFGKHVHVRFEFTIYQKFDILNWIITVKDYSNNAIFYGYVDDIDSNFTETTNRITCFSLLKRYENEIINDKLLNILNNRFSETYVSITTILYDMLDLYNISHDYYCPQLYPNNHNLDVGNLLLKIPSFFPMNNLSILKDKIDSVKDITFIEFVDACLALLNVFSFVDGNGVLVLIATRFRINYSQYLYSYELRLSTDYLDLDNSSKKEIGAIKQASAACIVKSENEFQVKNFYSRIKIGSSVYDTDITKEDSSYYSSFRESYNLKTNVLLSVLERLGVDQANIDLYSNDRVGTLDLICSNFVTEINSLYSLITHSGDIVVINNAIINTSTINNYLCRVLNLQGMKFFCSGYELSGSKLINVTLLASFKPTPVSEMNSFVNIYSAEDNSVDGNSISNYQWLVMSNNEKNNANINAKKFFVKLDKSKFIRRARFKGCGEATFGKFVFPSQPDNILYFDMYPKKYITSSSGYGYYGRISICSDNCFEENIKFYAPEENDFNVLSSEREFLYAYYAWLQNYVFPNLDDNFFTDVVLRSPNSFRVRSTSIESGIGINSNNGVFDIKNKPYIYGLSPGGAASQFNVYVIGIDGTRSRRNIKGDPISIGLPFGFEFF